MVSVGVEAIKEGVKISCANFAMFAGDGEDLVAYGFNGTGLMDVDMASIRSDHPLVGLQQAGGDDLIGLSPSGHEINLGLGTATGLSDLLCGGKAVLILAVAGKVLHVGVD